MAGGHGAGVDRPSSGARARLVVLARGRRAARERVDALAAAEARVTRVAACCRLAALAALLLALTGVSVERDRPATGSCIVSAVDVSASVGAAGIETARGFLRRLAPAL